MTTDLQAAAVVAQGADIERARGILAQCRVVKMGASRTSTPLQVRTATTTGPAPLTAIARRVPSALVQKRISEWPGMGGVPGGAMTDGAHSSKPMLR